MAETENRRMRLPQRLLWPLANHCIPRWFARSQLSQEPSSNHFGAGAPVSASRRRRLV